MGIRRRRLPGAPRPGEPRPWRDLVAHVHAAAAHALVSISAVRGWVLYSDGTGLYGSDGGPFTRIDDTTLITYDAGVGVMGIRGTPDDPTIWYSVDGRSWTRLPL